MATQDYAASVQGAVIRIARLGANGAPVVGASAAYTTAAFTRVSFTPEYEEGDEITEKNAAGEVCVTFKAPDTLKRVNLELAVCNPDPEITELLGGGTVLGTTGEATGYASAEVGSDPNPNGNALEVWSYAVVNGKKATVNPFWRWVFPYVQLRPSGDRVIENGMLATTFEGWGVGNAGLVLPTWTYPVDRPYAYARVATAPTPAGYEALTTV